jgi:hypothetical protein
MSKVKIVEWLNLDAEKLNRLERVTLFQNGSRAASFWNNEDRLVLGATGAER